MPPFAFSPRIQDAGSVLDEPVEGFGDSLSLVQDKLQSWAETAIAHLPNLMVALLVLLITVFASRLARSLSRRFLERFVSDDSIQRLLSTLAGLMVTLIGVFMALSALQLDRAVTSLLAGAGVVGLALAFAFQDLAANFIAGVYMSVQRPLGIGDIVETNDVTGTVHRIDLRNTILRTPDGLTVLLPNREIFENRLINYSRLGERRVDLAVGVSYGEDLDHVEQVVLDAVEGLEKKLTNRPVELYFEAFGSSSIDLVVRFWISYSREGNYLHAKSDAMRAIKRAFDAEGIMIPFPIRTLDFGIKGGEKLAEAWPERESSLEKREDPSPSVSS